MPNLLPIFFTFSDGLENGGSDEKNTPDGWGIHPLNL